MPAYYYPLNVPICKQKGYNGIRFTTNDFLEEKNSQQYFNNFLQGTSIVKYTTNFLYTYIELFNKKHNVIEMEEQIAYLRIKKQTRILK